MDGNKVIARSLPFHNVILSGFSNVILSGEADSLANRSAQSKDPCVSGAVTIVPGNFSYTFHASSLKVRISSDGSFPHN